MFIKFGANIKCVRYRKAISYRNCTQVIQVQNVFKIRMIANKHINEAPIK